MLCQKGFPRFFTTFYSHRLSNQVMLDYAHRCAVHFSFETISALFDKKFPDKHCFYDEEVLRNIGFSCRLRIQKKGGVRCKTLAPDLLAANLPILLHFDLRNTLPFLSALPLGGIGVVLHLAFRCHLFPQTKGKLATKTRLHSWHWDTIPSIPLPEKVSVELLEMVKQLLPRLFSNFADDIDKQIARLNDYYQIVEEEANKMHHIAQAPDIWLMPKAVMQDPDVWQVSSEGLQTAFSLRGKWQVCIATQNNAKQFGQIQTPKTNVMPLPEIATQCGANLLIDYATMNHEAQKYIAKNKIQWAGIHIPLQQIAIGYDEGQLGIGLWLGGFASGEVYLKADIAYNAHTQTIWVKHFEYKVVHGGTAMRLFINAIKQPLSDWLLSKMRFELQKPLQNLAKNLNKSLNKVQLQEHVCLQSELKNLCITDIRLQIEGALAYVEGDCKHRLDLC